MTHYNFHCKTFQNAYWVRIFFHDLSKSSFFSMNEAKSSTNENKFSALGELTALSAIKGCYEFLLEYPELKYQLRWQQTALPTATEKSLEANIGFKQKFCTHDTAKFIGLMLSSTSSSSYLDGSGVDLGSWRYSIGTINYQDQNGNDYIPGPVVNTEEGLTFYNLKQVFLWIRIKQRLSLKQCASHSYYYSLFLIILNK